jgi:hypothetical protein
MVRNSTVTNSRTFCLVTHNFPPASCGFSLDLLLDVKGGGDMFIRNVGLSRNYTAL